MGFAAAFREQRARVRSIIPNLVGSSAMRRRFVAPALYCVIALLLFAFMQRPGSRFLSAIAQHIFRWSDYSFHFYFSLFWLAATLLFWAPKVGFYIFVSTNAILLANSYFVIILRLYFLSFHVDDIAIYVVLVLGINTLMLLKRAPARDIAVLNATTMLSALPLALQYAIVAPCEEP